jgi:glycosyltransferase involved in cell wall biosynthesis
MITRKIKIAHIITRMDRGGAPDVVRILIEQSDPALFDETLIYGRTEFPTGRVKDFLGGLGPAALQIDSLRRDINPFYDLCAFFTIFTVLRQGKYDIVHTHTAKAGVLGRVAARCAGVRRVIHSPHGHNFYGYFSALGTCLVIFAEKFASFFCDKIHALTELEKKDMLGFGIGRPDTIEVISCGVELEVFKKNIAKARELREACGIPDEAPVVGYVGRLEPVKGPKFFIRAAARVHQQIPQVHFLVAGDGALRPRLEIEARRLGLGPAVHFIGWQEDATVVYSSLDIFVLSSLNEAVGRSIIEAQAIGVAVVASRVGGVPEIVRENITGLLVGPHDAKALAEAVIALLKDPSLREACAAAGLMRVKEIFTDAKMVRCFEGLYRGMLRLR